MCEVKILVTGSLLMAMLAVTGCTTPGSIPTKPEMNPAVTASADLHNPRADFAVELSSEHHPLVIGEYLYLKLRSTADRHLSLYAINSSGKTLQLLSNQPARANQTLIFPGPESPVDYQLIPPPGTETYILVGTHRPLYWLAPVDIRNTGPLTELNLTGTELLQRLRTVLNKQNPYAWNVNVLSLPLQRYRIKS